MNQRNYVRYGSKLLPGSLSKVTISWEGTASLASYVVNYSAQGINVVIPPLVSAPETPREHETVKVLMPIDQMWFTGTCIYVKNEQDGSISLGINFNDPKEQNYLKDLLFNSLKAPGGESHSFVSYEWEELVGKLCDSDDPQLKEIGNQHLAVMKAERDGRSCRNHDGLG
jgi:hypothetical protein